MQKNIVVIADDFTGAAELAGIALDYGLQFPIFLDAQKIDQSIISHGCIISTDSRSMYQSDALEATKLVLERVKKWNPDLLYKKIDSVLRGYVLAELDIQMDVLALQKALVAPANPRLGRIIKEGIYYINDLPIAETDFANDPEFPACSSLVTEILNNEKVQVINKDEAIPTEGVFIAEATTKEDTKAWAGLIDQQFALAGAGDFFSALLAQNFETKSQEAVQLQKPFLLVVGTSFESAKNRVQKWKTNARSILRLQECFELIEVKDDIWVLSINHKEVEKTALNLRTKMATVVKDLVMELEIQELVIEGGSTAASILNEMHIRALIPVNELSRGVVRMQAAGMFITVKPGSYQLPASLEKFLEK